MSGERKITVTFDGKDVGLGSAVDDVTQDLDKAERSARTAGEGFNKLGEGADVGEQRITGFRDTLTGAQDTMAGFSQISDGDVVGGLVTMSTGFADLASGISNLIAPFAAQVTAWVSGHATMAVAAVTSAAAQVGSWISLGISSLASAAQVALAWLISIAPIALVIAAVVGLVVLIIKNWDTIKRVTIEVFGAVWDFVKDAIGKLVELVKGIPGLISGALGKLAEVFLKPFRDAFDGIRTVWNSTVGGKGFSVPSWIPGIGGKSFSIPKLAAGGIVTGPTLALIGEAGPEAVVPLSKMGGATTLVIESGGSDLDRMLLEIFRKVISLRGGSVQGVLG